MRSLAALRLCLLLSLPAALGGAAEPDALLAVRAAEAQRLAATIAGDTNRLSDLLSDELRYAHSDGRVQTKAQFLSAVAANRIRYLAIKPDGLELQAIDATAVIVAGRARLAVQVDGRKAEFTLRFLAVWRLESGRWRLFAYQSSQLAPAG